MATRSELEILRPAGCKASGAVTADTVGRGDAARARVLETLDALIRKRFYVLLAELGVQNSLLLGTKPLRVSAISGRINEINKARGSARRPPLTTSSRSYEQELRADFEPWRVAGASIVVAPQPTVTTDLQPEMFLMLHELQLPSRPTRVVQGPCHMLC